MARNRYDMDEILEDSFDVNQLKRLAGYIAPYKKKMAGFLPRHLPWRSRSFSRM